MSAGDPTAGCNVFIWPTTGWICPKCNRGIAPTVTVCPCSAEAAVTIQPIKINPQPAPGTTTAPWPITWGAGNIRASGGGFIDG